MSGDSGALRGGVARPSDEQILRARAIRLAQPQAVTGVEPQIEVLQVRVGGSRYAIATEVVAEAVRGATITPLPGLPAWVLGIGAFRGEILSVMDLGRYLGEAGREGSGPTSAAVVLRHGRMSLAIAVDEIGAVLALPLARVQPPLATFPAEVARLLMGVTAERLVVVDGMRLLADERLVIRQSG